MQTLHVVSHTIGIVNGTKPFNSSACNSSTSWTIS